MNVRKRLTLLSFAVFALIFGLAAVIIYFTFYKSTEQSVQKALQKTCLISAIFYLEKDEQSAIQHKEVKRQFDLLIQSNMVAIYDVHDDVQFGDLHNDTNITESRLRQLKKNHHIYFQSNHHFYYGIYYPDNQGDFYVFVKEKNDEFVGTMNRLLFILFIVLVLGWLGIFVLSKFLSVMAYRPIKQIVQELKNKENDTLTTPLTPLNSKDELEELVLTYNVLLQRISDTFAIQRNFINYVSHEFRTPLAAISGTLEVYAQKERTPEEYQQATKIALKNVASLSSLLDQMLLLSETTEAEKPQQRFRIDEVIWEVITRVQSERGTPISTEVDVPSSEQLWVLGNEALLHIALQKLVENAVKYSNNKEVILRLFVLNNQLHLVVKDQGIGILPEDLPFVTQTFYRGKNTQQHKGSGVGLSLAAIIFKQHQIAITIHSIPLKGTEVALVFPSLPTSF